MKRKKQKETAEEKETRKKAKTSNFDSNEEFTLEIERCNSWSIYRTCANRIEKELQLTYPTATLLQNPKGKPRKGAFEVTIVQGENTELIYSKLQKYGPQKDRKALPEPSNFINSLFDEISAPNINQSNEETASDSDSDSQITIESSKEGDKSIEASEDLEFIYRSMSVLQLRKLLKDSSLSTSGRKEVLIQRLISFKKKNGT